MLDDDNLIKQNEALFGLTLTTSHRADLQTYLLQLEKWSRKMNLVSDSTGATLLTRHFFEAFWVAETFCTSGMAVADIGSGAGFPGLAMRLYRDDLRVTLIEKSFRKTVFLRHLSSRLEYRMEIFHGRAEDFPLWKDMDMATLRALKPSRLLVRILRKQRCRLLCLHGASPPETTADLQRVAREKVPGSARRFATLFDCFT